MKFLISFLILSPAFVSAQNITATLQEAAKRFENDAQMKHAVYGLYVADAATGKPVFDKNSQVGLATASCLKLVTSATAFERLGSDFQYETRIMYAGTITDHTLNGSVYIYGSGDPTLGSWRWETTKTDQILDKIILLLKQKGISKISGKIYLDDLGLVKHDVVPDGWTWEDMGNYYGAPARVFNWHENQYDMFIKTGNEKGSASGIVKSEPELPALKINNYVTAGPKGSGDRTVIYLPPYSATGYITGTVPAGEQAFMISGAIPDPSAVFLNELGKKIKQSGIEFTDSVYSMLKYWNDHDYAPGYTELRRNEIGTIISPAFNKMNFFFMRRSINLYGEAFLRTMMTGGSRADIVTYKQAIDSLKAFWKARGIEESALNICDGSGLSPANRVTPDALVKVMLYAKTRPWFSSYYEAFPEYNGMKLKSGTIGDVKGFAGYHKARNGREYIVAFLVNNYDGPSSSIVEKMYKVLDVLK